MVTAGTDKQLPKAEVVKNLTAWLQHLEMHPEQDIDCLLELKLPMSYLTRLMIQGKKKKRRRQWLYESCWRKAATARNSLAPAVDRLGFSIAQYLMTTAIIQFKAEAVLPSTHPCKSHRACSMDFG